MRWPSAINTMRSISTILRKKIEVFGQSRIRVIQYFFLFCVYIYIYIFFSSSSSLIALSYEQFTRLFDVQFIEYLSEDQKGRFLLIIKQRNGDCVLLSDWLKFSCKEVARKESNRHQNTEGNSNNLPCVDLPIHTQLHFSLYIFQKKQLELWFFPIWWTFNSTVKQLWSFLILLHFTSHFLFINFITSYCLPFCSFYDLIDVLSSIFRLSYSGSHS